MAKDEDYKQHISAQFNTELETVKNHMLEMGGLVEQQVSEAMEALLRLDSGVAETVIENDYDINQMEIRIDDECSRILARRQPAASDLRMVLAITKANTDLERIGDEACKIARHAIRLTERGTSPTHFVEIRHISQHVSTMLRTALDSFARLDVSMALHVVKEDTSVDQEYGSGLRSLVTFMMEDHRQIGSILDQMWALRSLERIGDHASNIAEHLIYLVRGLDVRHIELDELISQVEERGGEKP